MGKIFMKNASAHGHLGGEHALNRGGHLIECDFTQGHTTIERRQIYGYGGGCLHGCLHSRKLSACIFSNQDGIKVH